MHNKKKKTQSSVFDSLSQPGFTFESAMMSKNTIKTQYIEMSDIFDVNFLKD
jgi:hypothetical protein